MKVPIKNKSQPACIMHLPQSPAASAPGLRLVHLQGAEAIPAQQEVEFAVTATIFHRKWALENRDFLSGLYFKVKTDSSLKHAFKCFIPTVVTRQTCTACFQSKCWIFLLSQSVECSQFTGAVRVF